MLVSEPPSGNVRVSGSLPRFPTMITFIDSACHNFTFMYVAIYGAHIYVDSIAFLRSFNSNPRTQPTYVQGCARSHIIRPRIATPAG